MSALPAIATIPPSDLYTNERAPLSEACAVVGPHRMSIHVKLHHRTRYGYDLSVSLLIRPIRLADLQLTTINLVHLRLQSEKYVKEVRAVVLRTAGVLHLTR
jgi:hypothetical protein